MIKIFSAAKSALTAIPGKKIKHVALFKNQLRKLENKEQILFPCPAVFLQFMNITYGTNADRAQTGTGILRVYVVEFDLHKKDEDFFALRNQVHAALQGLKDEEHFSALNRIAESPDEDFDALTAWTMDYDILFNDDSARPAKQLHTVTTLTITRG